MGFFDLLNRNFFIMLLKEMFFKYWLIFSGFIDGWIWGYFFFGSRLWGFLYKYIMWRVCVIV